ncbi:hypothetical protein ACFFKC_08215 [Pseudoduganella danionis]|uniref:Uncharacterized protein n=1 Tax=Pseudoduganella danionis TaxID=1890295 RepID=A0ABW9STP0_9BURK|nr:hypothetical protein [Pseudoduganella danionis]MTW34939.1 hypothetical protein [Pseudoduganella danionis]
MLTSAAMPSPLPYLPALHLHRAPDPVPADDPAPPAVPHPVPQDDPVPDHHPS